MSNGRESKNTTRNIFAGLISSNEETAPTSNLNNAPIAGKKPKRVSFGRRITIHQPASSTSTVGSSSSMKMPSPVPTPSPLPPEFYNETHTIFDQFRQQEREIQEEKKGEDDENEKSSEEEETTFDEPNPLYGSPTLQLELTASDGSTNSGDEQQDHQVMGEAQHDDKTYHKTADFYNQTHTIFDQFRQQQREIPEKCEDDGNEKSSEEEETFDEFEKVWEAEMCQLEDEYVRVWEENKAKKERFHALDQKLGNYIEVLKNRMQSWREQNEQFEQDFNASIIEALAMAKVLQRK